MTWTLYDIISLVVQLSNFNIRAIWSEQTGVTVHRLLMIYNTPCDDFIGEGWKESDLVFDAGSGTRLITSLA